MQGLVMSFHNMCCPNLASILILQMKDCGQDAVNPKQGSFFTAPVISTLSLSAHGDVHEHGISADVAMGLNEETEIVALTSNLR